MIQYEILFWLLLFEMAIFMLLSIPSNKFQKKYVVQWIDTFLNFKYTYFILAFLLLYTLIMTLDSFSEYHKSSSLINLNTGIEMNNVLSRDHLHSKLFRAQRNTYLTVMTLFTAFADYQMYNLRNQLIKKSE